VPIIDIQQLSKLYYSIGEVAELLNVNASLLRFWEKEFQFEIAKKNAKGNRLFSVKEIEKINRIYHFVKIEGYTLDGAKKALRSKTVPTIAAESTSDHSVVIRKLEQIKARLVQLKSSLPSTDQSEVKAPVLEQKAIQITEATPKKPASLKSAPSTDMPSLFD
jgi:DNA-binding transcriptional MerR regulator